MQAYPQVYRVFFETLMQCKISVNRYKDRSIQVKTKIIIFRIIFVMNQIKKTIHSIKHLRL